MAEAVIGDLTLCIPAGDGGYGIRSATSSQLRFEEQYFVDSTRVTDVDPRTSTRPDGTKVTPVSTTIHTRSQAQRLDFVVREAIRLRLLDFQTGENVIIDVDGTLYGDMRLRFHQRADGKFETVAVSANPNLSPFEYFLVAFSDRDVNYVIGCSQSGSGDRFVLACTGGFDLGPATATVSLFAPSSETLDDSFEANRRIVSSFVAR